MNIPLEVKEPVEPKKKKKEESTFGSVIKVCFIIMLLIVNIFLIVYIVKKADNKKENIIVEQEEIKVEPKKADGIHGVWLASNNNLIVFDTETFSIYDDYNNRNDNYYKGSYTYVTGDEALEEMGYTEEDLRTQFGDTVKKEQVYSLKMKPAIRMTSGSDTSSENIRKNENWWFIIVINNETEAQGYNKTQDIRYHLVKE